jgi:uncharacterized protein (TIGR03437 family)
MQSFRKNSARLLMLCAISAGLGGVSVVRAQTVQIEPVTAGLSSPVLVTHAGDGSNRLFIVEQVGRIKVLQPGATTATEFLDIRSRVTAGGERGLLGLAFHPQFKTNRRFFVNYTQASDGATVVAEYRASQADANRADTAEVRLLTVAQPFANHNGGMIAFGPDGYLYIGMGDGGSANDPGNRAQNINDLLGKMLRIDVDRPDGAQLYSSPSDNPFFGPAPGRDEIYAVGLRNPWRFSFDRVTGQLYAGDVGQGQREEVSLITRGGNYGWRVYEGTRCTNNDAGACVPANYTAPLIEYDHGGGKCSITGGYAYRGARATLPLGTYVYGDYCTGEVFTYLNGASSPLLNAGGNVSSFGEDEAGELYVVLHGGSVSRLRNSGSPLLVTSVSGASYDLQPFVTPESIASAFGTGLAAAMLPGTTIPLPTNLGGTAVTVRDGRGVERLAGLYYVAPGQINFLVPGDAAAGYGAVVVTRDGSVVSSGPLRIVTVAPAIFTADSTGRGLAAALAQRVRGGTSQFEPVAQFDAASQTFMPVPIDLGVDGDLVYLNLFGTGIRRAPNTDGDATNGAAESVRATVGGVQVQVSYAGAQNQYEGLDQINLLLPASLRGRGDVDVVLAVDGQAANSVRVRIK